MIAKIALGVVLAMGSSVGTPVSADPNPFGTLSCSCRDAPSVGGKVQKHEIDRGISDGLSGSLPGPSH